VILRGAVFSGERKHLGASTVVVAEAVVDAASDIDPAAERAPSMSAEDVASWLVTQDGTTRTALAGVLAEELAAVRDAAHAQGFERGRTEAIEEARETARTALEALQAVHEQAEAAFAAERDALAAQCAGVVAEVFFKLAGSALVKQEAILGAVTEVLRRVRDERELRIHVHPTDLKLLQSAEAGLVASLPGRTFTLVADDRVTAGGCIVESALGSLDGRLEVQLAGLVETLRAARSGGAA
jgi:flagellar assembly protein FliH